MTGTVTPINGTRLSRVEVSLVDCTTDSGIVNGTYTGLTTTRDEMVKDDRLIYMVSDGKYTFSGEFDSDL